MADLDKNQTNDAPKNEVACVDNVIRITVLAPVPTEEAQRIEALTVGYLDRGEAEYLLIEINKFIEHSSAARKIWIALLSHPKIKKAAMYGRNLAMKTIATFVITATGRDNARFFKTEAEAMAWLQEK